MLQTPTPEVGSSNITMSSTADFLYNPILDKESDMKTETLEGLLVDELKDIYSAENQVLRALPKIIEAAESNDLRQILEKQFEETRHQAERIEQICTQLDVVLTNAKCAGMSGIVDESKGLIKSGIGPDLLNVALIGVAQRMEHYQIAAYGTARAHARQLGLMNTANLLGQILEEEKNSDHQLTDLAENRINVQAAMRQDSLVI